MLASTLLVKKRQGQSLTDDEIRFLVEGFCAGKVKDYQMSALAMAICVRGMDPRETATLTQAMLDSGDRLSRQPSDARGHRRVDKHSTGGLGDKVSLVLAPLLAACDLDVPMISGRGLGLTGGTLDKLESIEGFRTRVTIEESERLLRDVGVFIAGASDRIAPADRDLYAIRDVTGTVESIPLITASIMSKKLAASLDALVIDLKVGSGALMPTIDEARGLARSLVDVGKQAGQPTTVIYTDMDQPLGQTIGNAIEVNEAVEVLGGLAGVVRELTIELAAELMVQVDVQPDLQAARRQLAGLIDGGHAMERFQRMIHAQGGSLRFPLSVAPSFPIVAPCDGYLSGFDSQAIGQAVVAMGGGRRQKEDAIDHRVGVRVHGRVGDAVQKGEPILSLHHHADRLNDYVARLSAAVRIQAEPTPARPLILERLSG